MSLVNRIQEDLKDAMRAKDPLRLSTLRMLKAEVKNREIELRQPLADAEVEAVIRSMQKKRREAAESYSSANRNDLAEQELQEMAILDGYLPRQLGDDEIASLVDQVLGALTAEAPRAFGPIMGQVMKLVAGRADGGRVGAVVKAKLGG